LYIIIRKQELCYLCVINYVIYFFLGEGRVEPIPIELKNDRFGLGRQTVLREIAVKKMEMAIKRSKKAQMLSAEDFRQRKREEAMERTVTTDLILSQKACYTLDLKMVIF
jgi:hypothetical protein